MEPRRSLRLVGAFVTALLVLTGAGKTRADDRLGFLVGPTNVEAEWRSEHVYVDAGIWTLGLPDAITYGTEPPLQLRLGWRAELSPRWSTRLGPHFALARTGGFEDVEAVNSTRSSGPEPTLFGSLDAGLRYEAASGFSIGIDLPLVTLARARGDSGGVAFGPPYSLILMQLYAGWLWDLSPPPKPRPNPPDELQLD